jgi:hypothetical protein
VSSRLCLSARGALAESPGCCPQRAPRSTHVARGRARSHTGRSGSRLLRTRTKGAGSLIPLAGSRVRGHIARKCVQLTVSYDQRPASARAASGRSARNAKHPGGSGARRAEGAMHPVERPCRPGPSTGARSVARSRTGARRSSLAREGVPGAARAVGRSRARYDSSAAPGAIGGRAVRGNPDARGALRPLVELRLGRGASTVTCAHSPARLPIARSCAGMTDRRTPEPFRNRETSLRHEAARE